MAHLVLYMSYMKKLGLAVLIAALWVPASASADQCAFVSKAEADDAAALIDVGSTIVEFCQPCGDAPSSVKVTSVTKAETGFEGTWEVSVNGHGIDLAYTFIENGDGNYVNLSKMVDCTSEGVACMLDAHFAPLASAGATCDGGEKEDSLGSSHESGGCSAGGRLPASGSALGALGLALAALVLRRRARR